MEIAVEIKITTSRTRVKKSENFLQTQPAGATRKTLSLHWLLRRLPTCILVVQTWIFLFNKWLKVSDNSPTPTSAMISLVQLQIPSAWLSECSTTGLNSGSKLSSPHYLLPSQLCIYSSYAVVLEPMRTVSTNCMCMYVCVSTYNSSYAVVSEPMKTVSMCVCPHMLIFCYSLLPILVGVFE